MNKSDISCLKTSWAFDIPIHSRVLLVAILCSLVTLWASRVAAHFWCFCSRSARIIASMLPLLLSIHLKLTKQLSQLPMMTKVRSHGNYVCDVIIAHMIRRTNRHGSSKVILGPAW